MNSEKAEYFEFRARTREPGERDELVPDYTQVIPDFERAIALDPSLVSARIEVGLCLVKVVSGRSVVRHKQAMETGSKVSRTDEDRRYDRHLSERARQHGQAAVDMDPTKEYGHFVLGVALCQLGQSEEALAALERGLEHCPDSPALQKQVSRCRS